MKLKTAYAFVASICTIALANAAYLTNRAFEIKNGGGFDSFCDINSSVSCTNVLAHPLAQVFGVPFPMIALFVYPVLLAIALVGYAKEKAVFFKPLAILAAMGTAFNGFIIYREAVYIKSYCILCLFCTLIIVTVFAVSMAQNVKACKAAKAAKKA
ncbi:MAG: vitamin K epoxide reductase family protein [Patescibacteria group bacterium]